MLLAFICLYGYRAPSLLRRAGKTLASPLDILARLHDGNVNDRHLDRGRCNGARRHVDRRFALTRPSARPVCQIADGETPERLDAKGHTGLN